MEKTNSPKEKVSSQKTRQEFLTQETKKEIIWEITSIKLIPLWGVWYNELTWSSSLVEISRKKNGKNEKQYIWIDAGMYQWLDKDLELELNKTPLFAQNVIKRLIAIVITHSHLDHCWRVPMLANGKFNRPIFNWPIYAHNVCTRLMYYIWNESVHVMSSELKKFEEKWEKKKQDLRDKISLVNKFEFSNSKKANDKKNWNWKAIKKAKEFRKRVREEDGLQTKIEDARQDLDEEFIEKEADIQKRYEQAKVRKENKILYDKEDVSKVMSLVRGLSDSDQKTIWKWVDLKLIKANHILWSSQVLLKIYDDYWKKINLLFSGDIWRFKDPFILPEPDIPEEKIDFVQVESTYWDKNHPDRWEEIENFSETLNRIIERKWKILIPVFKQQRLQDIACMLIQLQRKNMLNPKVPIFADWGNVTEICNIYKTNFLNENEEAVYKDLLEDPNFRILNKRKNNPFIASKKPWIMLAPAGMLTWWSVYSYLKHILENSNNAMCISWYQAEDTLWRKIKEAKENGIPSIKDKKLWVLQINAEIIELKSQSGHADQEDLLNYLQMLNKKEDNKLKVAINHWEEDKMEEFQEAIENDKKLKSITESLILNLKEPVEIFSKSRKKKKQ